MTHDGWIQRTVELAGTGELSAEVEGWIAQLTDEQRDPRNTHLPPIPGDLDEDGTVGITDLLILLGAWGGTNPGDLDGDCTVGVQDLLVLLANWG